MAGLFMCAENSGQRSRGSPTYSMRQAASVCVGLAYSCAPPVRARACSTRASQQPTPLCVAGLQTCATEVCQCLQAVPSQQQAALAALELAPHGVVCVGREPAASQQQSSLGQTNMQRRDCEQLREGMPSLWQHRLGP